MYLIKDKLYVGLLPVSYMWLLLTIGHKAYRSLLGFYKSEEIYERQRIRNYWYGPIVVEVTEKCPTGTRLNKKT